MTGGQRAGQPAARRIVMYMGTGWRGSAFFVLCTAFGLMFLGSAMFPYTPLTVKKIDVVPSRVCAGESVEVGFTREWRTPNPVLTIREVEVTSYWRNVETGSTYPAATAVIPPDFEVMDGRIVSDLIRLAPQEPGTYRLDNRYEVFGRVLIAPASQVTPVIESVNAVEVMAC